MTRTLAFAYGVICYLAFLATFVYAVAFVAGVAPKHIDNGPDTALGGALAIDLALLGLFAVQHSVMARPAFKRWWTRFVPPAIERSTFVLASSLALAALFWQWRPLPQTIWQVHNEAARIALHAGSALGWVLVLSSTFLINHFDLFGLRQTWLYARRSPATPVPFVLRAFYRIVRHPLMLGFLIAFWSAPTMSAGRLLFAAASTGYILLAVRFLEERDLVAQFGDRYRDYQRRVPMILPWPRRSPPASQAAFVAPNAPGARSG